ncbi:MAG TPA: hypothetical protein PKM72_11125 [Nitrospirales bacterium]|nr:hypothetical protein [Nitrospirales bacterium]
MKQVLSAVLSVLFVVGLAGVSSAGMKDTLKGAAEKPPETSADAHAGMDMTEHAKEHAIEAQDATKKEAGGMMDQFKDGAKGKVNETQETANEKIDSIGK